MIWPPRIRELLARLRVLAKPPYTPWFHRGVLAFAVPLGILALYLLSFGPVARFYGANPHNLSSRLPPVLWNLYRPMDRMPWPRGLAAMLRRYNFWCMGVDRQQRQFNALMARLDSAVTLGMAESDVLAVLGQPLTSEMQGNQVYAIYAFEEPGVEFHLITNGFSIVFSNGLVVAKSPVLSGGH